MPDTNKKPYNAILSAAIKHLSAMDTRHHSPGARHSEEFLTSCRKVQERMRSSSECLRTAKPIHIPAEPLQDGQCWNSSNPKQTSKHSIKSARLIVNTAHRTHGLRLRCGSMEFQWEIETISTSLAIQQCLRDGKPILVAIAEGALFDEDAAHWVVIYGVGTKPNRVFISGKTRPGFSRQQMTWREFRSIWYPQGHGLVCSVKG